jgi:hypothetical protein
MADTPLTNPLSRRAVLGGIGGLTVLAVLPAGPGQAATPAPAAATGPSPLLAASTISLSTTWKFATDPGQVGLTDHWYATAFDDSGWQALLSGKSWESQGVNYAGYAWYRQGFTIPAAAAGTPLTIALASITSDDDVWFNGVRIGGLKGQYKYNNRKLRAYEVPASAVQFGAANTVAVRIWGGAIEGDGRNSGLIAGAYQAWLDPFRLMARPVGGATGTEVPLEAWDLSAAQQGQPFELVVRMDPGTLTSTDLSYSLQNYSTPITTGTAPISTDADGIARAVLAIDAATSRQIYLAGRPRLDTEMTNASGGSDWVDTGTELTVYEANFDFTEHHTLYRRTFPAGRVVVGPAAGFMYTVAVVGRTGPATITNLTVADTANASRFTVQANLQVGNTAYGDRAYTIASLPANLVGVPWIRTGQSSKDYAGYPLLGFTVDRDADVYVGVETRAPRSPWVRSVIVDNLNFAARDAKVLPALPVTFEDTPYGSLKLVDVVDCSTALDTEVHPYLQSSFAEPLQQFNTPGSAVDVSVNTVLGKPARECGYGWFAYRVGRGTLTPGDTYLLRIEYPEDKPRYCPIEIQVGQNYMDVGWRTGVTANDVYDPWPLSGGWQYYDVVVPLGALTPDGRSETIGAGGAGDGDARHGFWVSFLNKIKPGYQFSPWQGGPAVATIKLYEISPAANAPAITRPAGLPNRVLCVDWERQPTAVPAHLVDYAKLMGYSAVSPLTLKWAFQNFADPVAGYDSINVDAAHYWVTGTYVQGSGQAPPAAVPGVPSVHVQYLQATKDSGVDYIPRFEYGGSYDLPVAAQAIGADGLPARPNRFGVAGHLVANLLDARTWADLAAFIDSLINPYAAAHPQLKGALWRIRSDRIQPSYGPADVALFCAETGTAKPSGLSDAQQAAWAATGEVGEAYSTWWQGKRAAFHQQLVALLKSYRSDLTLYYYNWDPDKFAIMRPDLGQAAFYTLLNAFGGPTTYAADRAARATYTAADYTNAIYTGDSAGWLGTSRPDYALRPELYAAVPGMRLMAPAQWLCYADKPEYLNYFQTADGLAVSNAVSYDEAGARYVNPKFEGNMMLPGGGPFSMAVELLAYYHGDARTMNYTVYTYGRGFADAHRRFAQAFLALPAVPGNVVAGTQTDVKARVYPTANGTYVGIAYKGYTATTVTVDVPGTWTPSTVVTNLVTGEAVGTVIVGGKLRITLDAGPMQLNAFLAAGAASGLSVAVSPRSRTVAPGGTATYTIQTATLTGSPGSIQLSATGAPAGATVTFSPNPVPAGGQSAMSVATSATRPAGLSSLTVTGTAGGLAASAYAGLTVQRGPVITGLRIGDVAHSAKWQRLSVLRLQVAAYSDRNYIFTRVPSSLIGSQWIRPSADSKAATDDPLVAFTIDRSALVSVAVDHRLGGRLPWMDASWVPLAGARFTFYDNTATEIQLDTYQKTFPAGEVSLGPNAGGTFSATYVVVVT